MQPILATFSVGGTEVVLRAYSTFYALAWVVMVVLATVIAARRGILWWKGLLTFVGALVAAVIGARLLDVAVAWDYYAEDLSRVYQFRFTGFALYGGLALALATSALLARVLRLPLWRTADSAVPALAAGIVLMRTGCYLNGCCFGTVTSVPWGVRYPTGSPAWAHQVLTGNIGLLDLTGRTKPVHPTQLYEMIAALALSVLAVWLLARRDHTGAPRTPSGIPFLAFALGFTVFRLGNHFLRARLTTGTLPEWFYPLLYSLLCACLIALIVWRVRTSRPTVTPNEEEYRGDRR